MHISSIVSIEDITYNYIIYNQESLSQKFYNNYFTQLEIIFSRLYDLFLQYEINLRDFELMYINDVWCGIKAINKSTCSLSLLEKIYYVKQGLSDIRFKKYMSLHKEEIGRLKYFLFSLPSLILTLILLIRSKCNDYIKNKK